MLTSYAFTSGFTRYAELKSPSVGALPTNCVSISHVADTPATVQCDNDLVGKTKPERKA